MSILLDSDINKLKNIAFDNAAKLLSLNARLSAGLDETLSKCLELLVAEFRPQNKQRAAVFCDQLNQYMALRCSSEPISEYSLDKLEAFLERNQTNLGHTSQNLFILEYKLTKLYNEMMHLNRAVRGIVAPVHNFESRFRNLGEASTRLRNLTDELSRNNLK